MEYKKLQIAIVTNVIPSYRSDFYRRIFSNKKFDIKVYCQQSIPGMNLNTVHDEFKEYIKLVRFISIKKEKLAWQFLPISKLYNSYDIIIIYGNPRVLSNVVFSLLLKSLGKKVIIWGQAHAAGANPITEKLRLIWWRQFNYLFLYTDKEVDYLKNKGFLTQQMIGMNNGLNIKAIDHLKSLWTLTKLNAWKATQGLTNKIILLSCARLESKNHFEQMFPIIKQLIKNKPELLWCIIGDGEQAEYLKDLVNKEGLNEHVQLLGAIFDDEELTPWFLSSTVLIHPGIIGLSLIHAFSYGLPVITHDSLNNHGPEIAALKDGINGLLFQKGDLSSMQEAISQLISDDSNLNKINQAAYKTAKNDFNTEVMADRFCQLVTRT